MVILNNLVPIVLQHPHLLQGGMEKRSHYLRALHKVITGYMDSYRVDLIKHHFQGSGCRPPASLLEDLREIPSLTHLLRATLCKRTSTLGHRRPKSPSPPAGS